MSAPRRRPCPRCGRPTTDRHSAHERRGKAPSAGSIGDVRLHDDTAHVGCSRPNGLGTPETGPTGPAPGPPETPESSGSEPNGPCGPPIPGTPSPFTEPGENGKEHTEPPTSHSTPPRNEGPQGPFPCLPSDRAETGGPTTGPTQGPQGPPDLIDDYFT